MIRLKRPPDGVDAGRIAPVSEPRAIPAADAAAAAADGPWTVRRLGRWMVAHFSRKGIDSPRVVADTLLATVLGCERMRLYMEPDREPSPGELARLRELVARAARHEPLQFLVGEWPFRGIPLEVGPSTLIPRPATETLVERAVELGRASLGDAASGSPRPLRIVDACTGTGCIAIALARELAAGQRRGCRPLGGADPDAPAAIVGPPVRVVATELVPEAAALARRNIARHGLAGAIEVREGDLLAPLADEPDGSIDLLVANPPYVSDAEWEELEPIVRDHEPATALRGGRDGLDLVRRLVADAPRLLRPGGWLLVEIGHAGRDAALGLVAGPSWNDAEVRKDHEDFWRTLVARRA